MIITIITVTITITITIMMIIVTRGFVCRSREVMVLSATSLVAWFSGADFLFPRFFHIAPVRLRGRREALTCEGHRLCKVCPALDDISWASRLPKAGDHLGEDC